MTQIHGGDWAARKIEGLDFSASISPVPMPPSALSAVQASLLHADRYPDPQCRALRSALARRFSLQENRILCGNGAADLIYRLAYALRPRRALIPAPTFGEYRAALLQTGCHIDEYRLDVGTGFAMQEDILDLLTPGLDLLILCEPNNPTGIVTASPLLERILERCVTCGIHVMVDESFHGFLDPAVHPSLLNHKFLLEHSSRKSSSLLVLRSFTKLYAMAGIRLGWCACSEPELIEKMQAAGPPWSVSAPAQTAGLACLADPEYPQIVRELIFREKKVLADALEDIGCKVIRGEANFLLFYDNTPDLTGILEEEGIWIRDCSGFSGLGAGWYRVAVRSAEDNAALIGAMNKAHQSACPARLSGNG